MINLIVAVDQNNLIGKDGKLPWRLTEDLEYFKQVTWGQVILMGRKTYDSLAGPLRNRHNIVLTKDPSFETKNALVIYQPEVISLEMLQQSMYKDLEIFIIGGAEIFKLYGPQIEKIYLTRIHESFVGDTYFEFPPGDWELSGPSVPGSSKAKHPHTFEIYTRK